MWKWEINNFVGSKAPGNNSKIGFLDLNINVYVLFRQMFLS